VDQQSVVVLAPRQYEVARLASQGLTNKDIACVLGVSAHTVRNTMRVVFEKLQVENRVGVANAFAAGRVFSE
jgi:DNA-binding CsgD family transcriptional regulator